MFNIINGFESMIKDKIWNGDGINFLVMVTQRVTEKALRFTESLRE